MAQAPNGIGLKNSKHDFSTPANLSWNTRGGNGTNATEICYPCHTPHNGNEDVGYLWNHALSDPTLLTFGSTNDQLVANGKSLMCLGCHDGVTALDSYAGVVGTVKMTGDAAIGPDLEDDHPIGVDYSTASTNSFSPVVWTISTRTGLWGAAAKSKAASGLGIGKDISLTLELTSAEKASGSGPARIGCGTCHTAHSNEYGYFLRANNKGSAICITCHGTKWDGVKTH